MARMAVQHAHLKAGSSAAEQFVCYGKETPCWHPGTNSSKHRLASRLRLMLLAAVIGIFLLVAHLSHQQSAPGRPAEQQKLTASRPAASPQREGPTGPQTSANPTGSAEQDLTTQDRAWFLSLASPHEPRHQLPDRGYVSQAPFVSGDTFRSMSDWTFDDYTQPPGAAAWRPRDVKQGDIIFVKTDLLLRFFKERHTKINATYILISSNSACSDYSAPADPRSPCKGDRCAKYVADPQLGHWYGENMLPGYGPKTSPLPIGLASEYWPHGDSRALLEVALSAPAWEARRTSVYVAMKHRTNKSRKKVAEQMGSLPGALHVKKRVSYGTYLQQVAKSKFVAAPPGNGMDTHRAWEAIYLGAVPIIQRGPLDWLYEGLPVLLVDNFDMVNTTLLERYAADRNATQRSTDRAWAVYWHRELQRMQRQLRSMRRL